MNFRRRTLIKIATLYGVLFSYFKSEGKEEEFPYKPLLENTLGLIDFYVYGEGGKEIPILKKAISDINSKMSYIISNKNVVLNMLDLLIEDEKMYVRDPKKRKHLNKVQDMILYCPEYDPSKTKELDDSNTMDVLLDEIIGAVK